MNLSREEVQRLAQLTRIALSPEEETRMQAELGRVLEYVERLQRVDTTDVPETEIPARADGFREDVLRGADAASREVILTDFPDRTGDLLKVPAVFDKPKG